MDAAERLDRIIACSNASIFRKFDFSKIDKIFYPKNEFEIRDAIKYAKEKNLSITAKGGGSGLSGACTGGNYHRVFFSTNALKTVHEVNSSEGFAWVDPGLTPDQLNEKIIESNLEFLISPSSREMATIGGLISTDGGGNDTWFQGTMRDNLLAAELFDEHGNKFTVTHNDSFSENEELDKKLKELNLTINDLASSHGVLGFISKVKVKISKAPEQKEMSFGILKFKDLNQFGAGLVDLISQKTILPYSEAISYVMPEMKDKAEYPILIMKIPHEELEKVKNIQGNFEVLSTEKFDYYSEIRRSYPKMNPPNGTQLALFEGFGLAKEHLLNFEEIQLEIHKITRKFGFEPFGKYGHAPSKWYGDDNKPIYGYIQHSREVPLKEVSGKDSLNAIISLVDLCKELGITPKPEHKWWLMDQKRNRLKEIVNILGKRFNPWILEANEQNLLELIPN